MDPASFFQPSYAVSRERFLAAARARASRHDVGVDTRALDARGPAGETRARDVAVVGARRPTPPRGLSGGTPGGAGLVGSAYPPHVHANVLLRHALADGTAVILQHANN
ncbi:MAG: DUF2817 domain-containing protein, partial [Burkholderiales bacterium]